MLNFTAFFDDLNNDKETIQMILNLYLEEYADCHLRLRSLFEDQGWSELFILAHSLKGILQGFGETEIVPTLEAIEGETHNNEPASQHHIDLVCQKLPEIQAEIKQQLQAIS